MSNFPPKATKKVIPILDTIHKLPFNNEWLNCSPGKYYLQFLIESENFLLWCWQFIENAQIEKLQANLLSWESEQTRNSDSLLNKYYQFYESINDWRHHQTAFELNGGNTWKDFTYFFLIIASQYLLLMQKISDFDSHYYCFKLFTYIGILTRKSYFIPKWTESVSSNPSSFYQKLSDTLSWSDLADDYLKLISAKTNNISL